MIRHGIITIIAGHETTTIVTILPTIKPKHIITKTINLIRIKSADSQSLTSLLIIRPYGVTSKKDKLVLIVYVSVFKYIFLLALIP